MDIYEFVEDNCVRQMATEPKDFIGMTLACKYGMKVAFVCDGVFGLPDIFRLAQLVKAQDNMLFRTVTARFANGNIAVSYDNIPRLMEQLLAYQDSMTPEEFYHEFERIHPFVDGNGRIGAILYSVKVKKLWVHPPEMIW